MTSKASDIQFTANQSDHLITIDMKTAYGPITFSYSPTEVDRGIGNLVAEILHGHGQPGLCEIYQLDRLASTDVLKQSAETYRERAKKVFPKSALEQFSPGSQAYAQGTLELFADNLAFAINFMLDYLGVAALTLGKSNEDPESTMEVERIRHKLLNVLRDELGTSMY